MNPTVFDSIRSLLSGSVLQNAVTGLGTSRDPLQATTIEGITFTTDDERTALFHGDFMARRAVDKFPREALKKGFAFGSDSSPPELVAAVNGEIKRLDLIRKSRDAWIWARNYGGAVIVIGVDDGLDAAEPVNLARVRGVRWLEVVDRRYVTPAATEDDPDAPGFGRPSAYYVSSATGGATRRIHVSRLLVFRGPDTSDDIRAQLGSWDISVHDLIIQALAAYRQAWGSAGALLGGAQQGVFKIKGFAQMLMNRESDLLLERLRLVDLYRSALRSIVIDADSEGFEWKTASLAGSPELLQQFSTLISAAVETPVAILMGQSPAGLNATGESDFRGFYDRAEEAQRTYLSPTVDQLLRILVAAQGAEWPEDAGAVFDTLWTPTPSEAAALRQAEATADEILIRSGVALPEEIAIFRAGRGYGVEFEVDEAGLAARRRDLAAAYTLPAAAPEGMPPEDDEEPAEPAQAPAQGVEPAPTGEEPSAP